MPKDQATKSKSTELTDEDLDQAQGGASGLPTGKRQHKPYSLTTTTTTKADDPTEFYLGDDFAP